MIKKLNRNKNKIIPEIKRKVLLALGLLAMVPSVAFANEYGKFDIVAFDKTHKLPVAGYYNDNSNNGQNHENAINEMNRLVPGMGTWVDSQGHLIYLRSGYGGGYYDENRAVHPTTYSFNTLSPRIAAGSSFSKIESYYQNYIPLNNKYDAGPTSQRAYGYPAVKGRFTKKLIIGDPETRIFDKDHTGHIEMVSLNSNGKSIFGEYRFNGVSGNGESLSNAFFPDDYSSKVYTGKNEITASKFTEYTKTMAPYENYADKTGKATWENLDTDISRHALTELFNKFYVGGSAAAFKAKNLKQWNNLIRIDNSPKTSSATFTFWRTSGSYQSIVLPKRQINDLALKSVAVFDTDSEGNMIRRADGTYQTLGEFSRLKDGKTFDQRGDFRANAAMSLGKDYVIAINMMNMSESQSKTIIVNDTDFLKQSYVDVDAITIADVYETLKVPQDVKVINEETGEKEVKHGEWITMKESREIFNWKYKLDKIRADYHPEIHNYKMNDDGANIDRLSFDSVLFESAGVPKVAAGASIAFGGVTDNNKGIYPESSIIKGKQQGKTNAVLIYAMIPANVDADSNITNNDGWIMLPIETDDMGMVKITVKDDRGNVIPNGGMLEKGVKYSVDYMVEKVAGDRQVPNTTIKTVTRDKKNPKQILSIPKPHFLYTNRTDILKFGPTHNVPAKGETTLVNDIKEGQIVEVCGTIDYGHVQRGENMQNANDTICQEFTTEVNDMSMVELRLKDSTGKMVTEISPNTIYTAEFVVKKELGKKVVNPVIVDTTVNGKDPVKITVPKNLELGKTVDADRTVIVPPNTNEVEICGTIATIHDTKKENIRDKNDTICKTYGQKFNYYVKNLSIKPSQGIVPEDKGVMQGTPVRFSFTAGLETNSDVLHETDYVIKDNTGKVYVHKKVMITPGVQQTIAVDTAITGLKIGSHTFTVEINPSRNPKEILPKVSNPYLDNVASTAFSVVKNPDCFTCFDVNTRIDWVLEYTTTIHPGVRVYPPKGPSYCRKLESYKTVDKVSVNFFEIYKFESIMFRSKYTQDNASRMAAKVGSGVISNDGWINVMKLPSAYKKYVGIKSGYGFELKVVTYYDTNFDCKRDKLGRTIECDPSLIAKDCYSGNDAIKEISYAGRSTNLDTGSYPPTYISSQTSDFKVCVEWPFKDDFGNRAKMILDQTGSRNGQPREIWRTYELPSRDTVKKGHFERKMYINRDVEPNVIKGPTYTVDLTTNRKQGLYTPEKGKVGWLQDCFSFDIYIVGKMEEDIITHIMD